MTSNKSNRAEEGGDDEEELQKFKARFVERAASSGGELSKSAFKTLVKQLMNERAAVADAGGETTLVPPEDKDLDAAFVLADEDEGGTVDEQEFLKLFRLIRDGKIAGLGKSIRSGSVKRRASFQQELNQESILDVEMELPSSPVAGAEGVIGEEEVIGKVRARFVEFAASNGGELSKSDFKTLVKQLMTESATVTDDGGDTPPLPPALPPRDKDLDAAFVLSDENENGMVDEQEFLQLFRLVRAGKVAGLGKGSMFRSGSVKRRASFQQELRQDSILDVEKELPSPPGAGAEDEFRNEEEVGKVRARFVEFAASSGGELSKSDFKALVDELIAERAFGSNSGNTALPPPTDKDLDAAFSIADENENGMVDEQEFLQLFRLVLAGKVAGLGTGGMFRSGSVKRRASFQQELRQDSILDFEKELPSPLGAGAEDEFRNEEEIGKVRAHFVEFAAFSGGELSKSDFKSLVKQLMTERAFGSNGGDTALPPPTDKDLDAAFSIADENENGMVDEQEFLQLFRLVLAGKVAGLGKGSMFRSGSVKRRASFQQQLRQDSILDIEKELPSLSGAGDNIEIEDEEEIDKLRTRFLEAMVSSGGELSKTDFKVLVKELVEERAAAADGGSSAALPSLILMDKDLDAAFKIADKDRNGKVDEQEFLELFRLVRAGKVPGLGRGRDVSRSRSVVKRRASFTLNQESNFTAMAEAAADAEHAAEQIILGLSEIDYDDDDTVSICDFDESDSESAVLNGDFDDAQSSIPSNDVFTGDPPPPTLPPRSEATRSATLSFIARRVSTAPKLEGELEKVRARFLEAAVSSGGELSKSDFKPLVKKLMAERTAVANTSGDTALPPPTDKDLDAAFTIADENENGMVDEQEFLQLFRLVLAGKVSGLGKGSMFRSGSVKRRASFQQQLRQESIQDIDKDLPSPLVAGADNIIGEGEEEEVGKVRARFVEFAASSGGELSKSDFKTLVKQLMTERAAVATAGGGAALSPPTDKDLDAAFVIADEDEGGTVDEQEFLKLFRLVHAGKVSGLGKGGSFFSRSGSMKRRASFEQGLRQESEAAAVAAASAAAAAEEEEKEEKEALRQTTAEAAAASEHEKEKTQKEAAARLGLGTSQKKDIDDILAKLRIQTGNRGSGGSGGNRALTDDGDTGINRGTNSSASFLSAPSYGSSEQQGQRPSMEDKFAFEPSFLDPSTSSSGQAGFSAPAWFAGVFDGHGGNEASTYLKDHLSSNVSQALLRDHAVVRELSNASSSSSGGDDARVDQAIRSALANAFLSTDHSLLAAGAGKAGSTATTVLRIGHSLYCANTGDSRSVLCRCKRHPGKAGGVGAAGLAAWMAGGVTAHALSVDQKPSSEAEKARIVQRGGVVLKGRLMGELGVARAFGDESHKSSIRELLKKDDDDDEEDEEDEEEDEDLGPDDPRNLPLLICDPEITRTDLKPGAKSTSKETEEDDALFVLLACDGLWDVMDDAKACDLVCGALIASSGDVSAALESVTKHAIEKLGSTDNVTAVLVLLKPWDGCGGAKSPLGSFGTSASFESPDEDDDNEGEDEDSVMSRWLGQGSINVRRNQPSGHRHHHHHPLPAAQPLAPAISLYAVLGRDGGRGLGAGAAPTAAAAVAMSSVHGLLSADRVREVASLGTRACVVELRTLVGTPPAAGFVSPPSSSSSLTPTQSTSARQAVNVLLAPQIAAILLQAHARRAFLAPTHTAEAKSLFDSRRAAMTGTGTAAVGTEGNSARAEVAAVVAMATKLEQKVSALEAKLAAKEGKKQSTAVATTVLRHLHTQIETLKELRPPRVDDARKGGGGGGGGGDVELGARNTQSPVGSWFSGSSATIKSVDKGAVLMAEFYAQAAAMSRSLETQIEQAGPLF